MNPHALLLDLARASLQAAVIFLAVALLVRFIPRMPAGVRVALWWIASLRALVGLLPLPPLPLPVLSANPLPAMPATEAPAATTATGINLPDQVATTGTSTTMPDLMWLAALALILIWCAGFVVMSIRHVRNVRRILALWRNATPLHSATARGWLERWLGASRARHVELRTSVSIGAPLILGWGKPRVLLPATFGERPSSRARMALAHETGHLLRRDLWWGWVPLLAEGVFWFHPLVRWGVREYAQSREEACDAHAISLTGAEPASYGDMLVRFGVDRVRVGHAAASCGSPHVRHLERRLHMLSRLTFLGAKQRALAIAFVLLFAALALVPVNLVAHPHESTSASSNGNSLHMSWSADVAHDFSYGLLKNGDMTFSGSFDDGAWARVKRIHEEHPGRIFWFRLEGKDYYVEDQATWREVVAMLEPQRVLGARQSDLGAEQSDLGARQSELGLEQSKLGARQSRLSAEMSSLSRQMAAAGSRSERRDIKNRIEELQRQATKLGRDQAELGRRQSELGEQQARLGEKQAELGALQSEESERARVRVRKVAEQCLRDGRAQLWED